MPFFQAKKYGFAFNGQLDFWDLRYYSTLIEETKYSVDQVDILSCLLLMANTYQKAKQFYKKYHYFVSKKGLN